MRDTIKQFLTKRNIIGLLVVGIVVLSIPIAVQLAQKQQIFKSRATGCSDGQYDTANGCRTLEQMKAELQIAQWPGPYDNVQLVIDTYRRLANEAKNPPPKTQCVARFQEEFRTQGDQASRDPWTASKVIAIGNQIIAAALDTSGASFRSGATLTLTGPSGTRGVPFNQLFDPGGAGIYTLHANGDGCNDATAILIVSASCANSCSLCIVKSHGFNSAFLATYKAGGWVDASCNSYDAIVDNWCTQVNKVDCDKRKANQCKAECSGGGAGGYSVAGHLKDPSGNPVSGVSVDVVNDTGGKQTVTTGSDGGYSVSGIAQSGRLYAVRLPDQKGKTSNSDRSVRACNNVNSNTPADQPSYECQLPNSNDCKDRCDFVYTSGGTGETLPAPATASSQCSGSSGNSVTVSWSAVSGAGGYFIRVNRLLQTPPDTSTDDYDPNDTREKDQGIIASGADTASKVITVDANAKYHFTVQTLKPGETHSFDTSRIKDAGTQTCSVTETGCRCSQANTCSLSCQFTPLTGVTYTSPIKCSLDSNIHTTQPTADNKNSWCNRVKRTLGDADGDGQVNTIDYVYYLRAVLRGKLPPEKNPDFNGDGEVGLADLAIWVAGRGK